MNNPDLGNLEIVERPLVIHEAKAGGRRLTKTLFRQLPNWMQTHNSLILTDCSADIVAWVSYHWKDCDWMPGRYVHLVYGAHKHILLNENGKPYRGTIWREPKPNNTIDINFWDETGVGDATAALLSRRKIEGKEVKAEKWKIFHVNHKGRQIRFQSDEELSNDLNADITSKYDYGTDRRERLVKVSQIQEEREVLIAKVDEYIATVDSFRTDVKQTWDLVTMETPQVFL